MENFPRPEKKKDVMKKKGIKRHRWAHQPVSRGNYSFRIFFYHYHTMSCDYRDGVRLCVLEKSEAQAQYDWIGWPG